MSEGGSGDRPRLRVRATIDEWFLVFVGAVLVVAAVGGCVTYTAYVSLGTSVEERQASTREGNGTYSTAATVTEPNRTRCAPSRGSFRIARRTS